MNYKSQIVSTDIQLGTLETQYRLPVAEYVWFSCNYDGLIGTGVITIYGSIGDSPNLIALATPTPFLSSNAANLSVVDIDVGPYSHIVFVVTTAQAGATVTLNTYAVRY